MSVVVRMEMPESCDVCPCLDDDGDYPRCRISGEQRGYNFPVREKRMPNCPIVCALPEEHGRLVDADAMAKDLEYDCELDARGLDDMTIVGHEREHLQFDKDCKQNCMRYLTEQETIVPAAAERSEV